MFSRRTNKHHVVAMVRISSFNDHLFGDHLPQKMSKVTSCFWVYYLFAF